MKSTFWPYSKDPYEIFEILLEDPRIPKSQMTRIFNVNPKTFEKWWKAAIEKGIIILPVFRRKSFLNFREYFYFLRVEDPHRLYKSLQRESESLTYFSVQTGFCNFQIISNEPIAPEGEIILSGPRSDYFVTTPPNCRFEKGVKRIEDLLQDLGSLTPRDSPLQCHDITFEPWDEMDEAIFREICHNVRKPFASVVKSAGTYNDKAWSWFRNRDKFGDTITMFFPKGESSYQLSLYCIETQHDSLIIDIFSQLPTSSVFYRIRDKLMMCIYLPFFPSPEARIIPFEVLSVLKRKELVDDYTNSVVQYGYRP